MVAGSGTADMSLYSVLGSPRLSYFENRWSSKAHTFELLGKTTATRWRACAANGGGEGAPRQRGASARETPGAAARVRRARAGAAGAARGCSRAAAAPRNRAARENAIRGSGQAARRWAAAVEGNSSCSKEQGARGNARRERTRAGATNAARRAASRGATDARRRRWALGRRAALKTPRTTRPARPLRRAIPRAHETRDARRRGGGRGAGSSSARGGGGRRGRAAATLARWRGGVERGRTAHCANRSGSDAGAGMQGATPQPQRQRPADLTT